MKVYRVRNKETGEFWKSGFTPKIFLSSGSAKGSYTTKHRWPNEHTFDEQSEYEIVEFNLMEVKNGNNKI